LWLPLASRNLAYGATLLVGLLYIATMSRGIGFYDSGELAVASVQLGLAHPPGQPVYTLVGWLFAHLPWLTPILGLNLLSALCGALTMIPAISLAEHLLPDRARENRAILLASTLTLVAISQHAALWEQATRIELYALATLLALWSLARLAFVLDHSSSAEGFLLLGAGLGLCAAVNPVIAALAALCGAPAAILRAANRSMPWSAIGWIAGGVLLGLVPYVYVPLIADRTDRLVWGAPTRGAALIDYLMVRDFRQNIGVSAERFVAQVAGWVGFASDSGLLPVWLVGLTGHAVSPPQSLTRWCAPFAALLTVLYSAHYHVFRPEVPDSVSYTALTTWLCAAGCAALTGLLWLRGSRFGAMALAASVVGASLIAPPFALTRTRNQGDPARTLVTALLDSLPPNAILVAESDHWVAPLWYVQEVERQRPDVVVIASGLLSSSWYFERMYRLHPSLEKVPLRGPGGALGRLARLIAAHPQRAVAFEVEHTAAQLGLETCVGPVFAHARTACSALPADRTRYGELLARLTRQIDAGELTVGGVLAHVSLERARLLANHGHMADALRSLFAGIDPVMAELDARLVDRVSTLPPRPLAVPHWQREAAIGDAARNLFLAAQLAGAAGDHEHAVMWLLLARELGLPEAADLLANMVAPAAAP
jgi:hypothetical protein